MPDQITSNDFYNTLTDPIGVGNVVFNNTPVLKSPVIGQNISQILTKDSVTTSSLPDQVIMSFNILNEQDLFQTFGSCDITIQADVSGTMVSPLGFPIMCVQRKVTKLLAIFDNNTDWITNEAIFNEETGELQAVLEPIQKVYLVEYANILSSGAGIITDLVGSYTMIVNKNTLTYDLIVTPSIENYIQYKIISNCIISNEYIWCDPTKRSLLLPNGSIVTDGGNGDNGVVHMLFRMVVIEEMVVVYLEIVILILMKL